MSSTKFALVKSPERLQVHSKHTKFRPEEFAIDQIKQIQPQDDKSMYIQAN